MYSQLLWETTDHNVTISNWPFKLAQWLWQHSKTEPYITWSVARWWHHGCGFQQQLTVCNVVKWLWSTVHHNHSLCWHHSKHLTYIQISYYWVVQAGLLTPLTFAWHRSSPLAAFTSSAYFLHNGRRWQWICEFYTANFKDIFGGP